MRHLLALSLSFACSLSISLSLSVFHIADTDRQQWCTGFVGTLCVIWPQGPLPCHTSMSQFTPMLTHINESIHTYILYASFGRKVRCLSLASASIHQSCHTSMSHVTHQRVMSHLHTLFVIWPQVAVPFSLVSFTHTHTCPFLSHSPFSQLAVSVALSCQKSHVTHAEGGGVHGYPLLDEA